MSLLRMGTRGSPLALAQSGWAARALERLHPGLKVETVVIKTSGDLFGAPPPEQAKLLPQGAKGLWVKEIEEALLDRRIDFACHSAKDLPTVLALGLSIAAYPEREDPRDTYIGPPGFMPNEDSLFLSGMRIGTSSLRRQILLREIVDPGVEIVPMRGNLDTRLRKLAAGEYSAIIVALAGLKRLGRADVPNQPFNPGSFIPAPAQGALALEVKTDRSDIGKLVARLDHYMTRQCVEIERAFLEKVGGGCGAPVAAYAEPAANGGLSFNGFFVREGETRRRTVGAASQRTDTFKSFVLECTAKAMAE